MPPAWPPQHAPWVPVEPRDALGLQRDLLHQSRVLLPQQPHQDQQVLTRGDRLSNGHSHEDWQRVSRLVTSSTRNSLVRNLSAYYRTRAAGRKGRRRLVAIRIPLLGSLTKFVMVFTTSSASFDWYSCNPVSGDQTVHADMIEHICCALGTVAELAMVQAKTPWISPGSRRWLTLSWSPLYLVLVE